MSKPLSKSELDELRAEIDDDLAMYPADMCCQGTLHQCADRTSSLLDTVAALEQRLAVAVDAMRSAALTIVRRSNSSAMDPGMYGSGYKDASHDAAAVIEKALSRIGAGKEGE